MTQNEKLSFFADNPISVMHETDNEPYTIPHIHSYYEIYYNISGADGFMANGEFYRCKEKDLILIPALSVHKVIVKKNHTYNRCLINIEKDEFMLSGIYADEHGQENVPPRVNLSDDEHEYFMSLIQKHENSKQDAEKKIIFNEISCFLKKMFQKPHGSEIMDENLISYTDRIIKIIEKDFPDTTVGKIASKIYASADHINRVFRCDTGTTIKQYLIMRRLAEAQKYLFSGKSVKEACFLSGFNDYSNFCRTYKKYKGYSPGNF